MKSGVKTTEFWITSILSIVGGLMALDVLPQESIWARVGGAILAAAASLGYTWSRTKIKTGG